MSYTKQNFTTGQVLKASHLNYMESGISDNADAIATNTSDIETLNNNLETTNTNLDSLSKTFIITPVTFTVSTNINSTHGVYAYKIGRVVYVSGYIISSTNTGTIIVGNFSESPIVNTQIIAQVGDPSSPYCVYGNLKIDGSMDLNIPVSSTAYRFNFCYITN